MAGSVSNFGWGRGHNTAPPLSLLDGPRVWHHTYNVNISRPYVYALLSVPELHRHGILQMDHCRPEKYYKDLLQGAGLGNMLKLPPQDRPALEMDGDELLGQQGIIMQDEMANLGDSAGGHQLPDLDDGGGDEEGTLLDMEDWGNQSEGDMEVDAPPRDSYSEADLLRDIEEMLEQKPEGIDGREDLGDGAPACEPGLAGLSGAATSGPRRGQHALTHYWGCFVVDVCQAKFDKSDPALAVHMSASLEKFQKDC